MGIRSAYKSWERLALVVATALPVSFCSWTQARAGDSATNTSQGSHEIVKALQRCRAIKLAETRLSCFDDVASRNSPPKYAGKLGYKTAPFKIERPHVLRYRSKGVIFVLYVLDEKGEVIQNLHIGGGGEETYILETPGTYALQIDGSAGWKIWIDPVEPPSKP